MVQSEGRNYSTRLWEIEQKLIEKHESLDVRSTCLGTLGKYVDVFYLDRSWIQLGEPKLGPLNPRLEGAGAHADANADPLSSLGPMERSTR